jgi:hypothetical protein
VVGVVVVVIISVVEMSWVSSTMSSMAIASSLFDPQYP